MSSPERRLATVALVVGDYDEAVRWYVEKLGFALAEDIDLGGGKRWVTLDPGNGGARLLLARARDRRHASATRPAAASFCSWRPTTLLVTMPRCFRRASPSRKNLATKATARSRCSPTFSAISGISSSRNDRLPSLAGLPSAIARSQQKPGCFLQTASLYRDFCARPSSSGQDTALSRREQGFDSPWAYQSFQTLAKRDGKPIKMGQLSRPSGRNRLFFDGWCSPTTADYAARRWARWKPERDRRGSTAVATPW